MNFHFLRPEWFFALIPVFFIVWWFFQKERENSQWKNIIDPEFQKYLLKEDLQSKPFAWHLLGLAFIWILTIVILAGPTWQSVKAPAEKNLHGSVIVLDLSLSMFADDIKPNRITRVRYKIRDLLEKHPEQALGMVVYSGTAHTITPISQDNKTLLNLIPTLNPSMMPLYGSDVLPAMQQAQSLFEGSKITHGHILWITDDLEAEQSKALQTFFAKTGYSLSILAVGTQQGGAINVPEYGLLKDDAGRIVLPKLPLTQFENFAENTQSKLLRLDLAADDFEQLLSSKVKVEQNNDSSSQLNTWLDAGVYLLWGLIPIAAFAFRRGWLVSISLVFLIPLDAAQNAYADTATVPEKSFMPEVLTEKKSTDMQFTDVFLTADRQGFLLWQKGDIARAETRFESPDWKGTTLYQLGKYDEAIKQFALSETPLAQYNLANSLAYSGQLEQAKKTLETLIAQHPDYPDAAENLDLISKLLEQQKAQQQQNSQQNTSNQQQNAQQETQQNSQQDSQLKENQPSDPNQKNKQQADQKKQSQQAKQQNSVDSDPKNQSSKSTQTQTEETQKTDDSQKKNKQSASIADSEQNPDQADNTAEQVAGLEDKKAETGALEKADLVKNEALSAQEAEKQQATQTWLKQIPDDPGLFLKRKFDHQFQNQQQVSQQEQQKIW